MMKPSIIISIISHNFNYLINKKIHFETYLLSLNINPHLNLVLIGKVQFLRKQFFLILDFLSGGRLILILSIYSFLVTILSIILLVRNKQLKNNIACLENNTQLNLTLESEREVSSSPVLEIDNPKSPVTIEDIGVPEYIVSQILKGLIVFENEKRFISKEISLQSLAKEIGTNPRYLSKVINARKEMKFTNYIKNLRIDYAKTEILENPKFRMYTVKAIADECGFKSSESFSKTFHKKHGIYPSQYIQEVYNT